MQNFDYKNINYFLKWNSKSIIILIIFKSTLLYNIKQIFYIFIIKLINLEKLLTSTLYIIYHKIIKMMNKIEGLEIILINKFYFFRGYNLC